MKTCSFILLALLILAVGSGFTAEQTATQKISMNLTDADISQALTELSQKTEMSIMGDSTVLGKITCNLSEVTPEQALDVLCKTNKLEWTKVYATAPANESLTASRLFNLLDALKQLGSATVVHSNADTATNTIFVPGAAEKSLDLNDIATKLGLKTVYLIRAIPDPTAQTAQVAPAAQTIAPTASNDVRVAADQVWNYIQQIPTDQRMRVMGELRDRMFGNMRPGDRETRNTDQQRTRRGGDNNRQRTR